MRIGKKNLSPVVQWTVAFMRKLLYFIPSPLRLTISSVGLNVTSLKWTGPDPESSETLPKIPDQIKYNETVERVVDIGSFDLVNQGST